MSKCEPQPDLETDGVLQLKYVFTPAPNPIRASVSGGDPNNIDLQIMVSNPSLNPVEVQTLTIDGKLAIIANQSNVAIV